MGEKCIDRDAYRVIRFFTDHIGFRAEFDSTGHDCADEYVGSRQFIEWSIGTEYDHVGPRR